MAIPNYITQQNPALSQRNSNNRTSKYSAFANTNNYQYTKGGQFATETGEEYIGEYHLNGEGVAFVGPTPPSQQLQPSKRLIAYYENLDHFVYDRSFKFNTLPKQYTQPTPHVYTPNEAEGAYVDGFDFRYFVQKYNSDSFAIEIKNEQFNNIGKRFGIDNSIYAAAVVRWRLTGTLSFIEQTNKANVNVAAQLLPGLPYVISSYTQYSRITSQFTENDEDSDLVRPQYKNRAVIIKKTFDSKTGVIIS